MANWAINIMLTGAVEADDAATAVQKAVADLGQLFIASVNAHQFTEHDHRAAAVARGAQPEARATLVLKTESTDPQ